MENNMNIDDVELRRNRKTDGVYASPYYDPDKAHEYYMKHRKLKGRHKKATTAYKVKTHKAGQSSSSKSSSKKSSSKKSSSSSKKYSDKEKALLKQAKTNTDTNIQTLKDTVNAWVEKQQALIEKSKSSAEKKAIRKRIAAIKKEMNKQIKAARAIYKKYKEAYTNHNIEKFAVEQAKKE